MVKIAEFCLRTYIPILTSLGYRKRDLQAPSAFLALFLSTVLLVNLITVYRICVAEQHIIYGTLI